MWNDIGYPAAADLGDLFAYYYNHVPDGVINDRFTQGEHHKPITDTEAQQAPRDTHYDFITPEYRSFDQTQTQKWETCRGIGHSFGYNRNEGDDQLIGEAALVHLLVDIVSKNGNLLLNIGPMADGTIPQNQRERLESLGRWLNINGEAIFDTRPWVNSSGQTTSGIEVRYTQQGHNLYAICLGWPDGETVIKSLNSGSSIKAEQIVNISMLGSDEALRWSQDANGLRIQPPASKPCDYAYSYRIELKG
jgi:alpha-L-fucosidase